MRKMVKIVLIDITVKFCGGDTNENEQKFLKLSSLFFPKKESREWPWESPA